MYFNWTNDKGLNNTIQWWLDSVASHYDIISPLIERKHLFVFNESNEKNLSGLDLLYNFNLN